MIIGNSFKYFIANYRDNWYWTIIFYVASFAAYLNRGVTLVDFQSSGNIPKIAKDALNIIIEWSAIKSAQSIISWLDISSGPEHL